MYYEIILQSSENPKFNNEESILKLIKNWYAVQISSLFHFDWYKTLYSKIFI